MRKKNFLLVAIIYAIAAIGIFLYVTIQHWFWDVWLDYFKGMRYAWLGFRIKFNGGSDKQLFEMLNKERRER